MYENFRSGFICIAGLANAGKSTLTNALVGEKVSIVSWRPQTTRNKLLGIVNRDDFQMVLIDTPGIHKARNQLGEYMMLAVEKGLKDVDGVAYVIDAAKGLQKDDYEFLQKNAKKVPIVVALNKQDAVTQETLFESLAKLNEIEGIKAIVPISAKKQDNVEPLLEELVALLPYGVPMYPADMFTDSTMRFMATEIIREKALYLLDKEVPYGIGVYINKFEEREDKPICEIDADIIVEKQSHKAIVIGKGGEMLKQIATKARKDLEEMIGTQVFLTLYVRVKNEWRDNDFTLKELGYDIKALKKD
ncbi:MAG: GTPase Era [Clostridia bacterium]|nr:GTPase Era [Clostridia bacterium]